MYFHFVAGGEDTLSQAGLGQSRLGEKTHFHRQAQDSQGRGRRQTFMGRSRIVKAGGEDKHIWAVIGESRQGEKTNFHGQVQDNPNRAKRQTLQKNLVGGEDKLSWAGLGQSKHHKTRSVTLLSSRRGEIYIIWPRIIN